MESKKLDVAMTLLQDAEVPEGDIDVIGGGVLGVIDESNWVVCAQKPSAGEPLTGGISLTVERTCDEPEAPATPSPAATATNEEPAEEAPAEVFTMPKLVGDVLQDAQDELQSLGSYVLRQDDATGAGRFQVLDSNWKVCQQEPSAGTSVPTDRLVVLTAVKLSEACP
ncbi:hypothetical protein C6I20_07280 [Aeromicrobium sp. A1-2]|uniref:PASTA domain-containing protein n=1 Tax=Aeromicrobium sp. A1-2 TaxID=2107713 RepID=UPI000E4BB990|nr:PASTA domain-containing protein [Aeromicrobium sp. A1-2]AXT85006.1 hypothetical protein C6I20_07280 [Aeromicrobium sp. A1-2]